jgi:hypothetical protein
MIDPIKIEGLAEFNRSLRKLDTDLPKALRLANNDAAEIVSGAAKPKVARRSGRAGGSLKTRSTRTEARVSGGSKRVPYYAWLDFGGRVGRRNSVRRPFIKSGRYIYPAFAKHRADVRDRLVDRLQQVVHQAGLGGD